MGNKHSKPKNAEKNPQFIIQGGVQGSHNIVGEVSGGIHYGSKDLLKQLRSDFVSDAVYNSAKRQDEHAVTCQPETRTKVLKKIRSWADNTTTPICWLSGPAGTGKTTVAHTIADEYDKRGILAASFFFWRKTGDRDKIHKLVPTLAYQIAKKNSSVKEQLEKDLDLEVPLSTLALEHQLEKVLVLNPNVKAKPRDFMLVVIDGLDECDSPKLIKNLIEWIQSNTYPFRILFTSRPEPHITECFRFPPRNAKSSTLPLSLTESKEDIRNYFLEHLGIIKERRLLPWGQSEWPARSDLDRLVEKSEGLFIYAATVVRYIEGEGDPIYRLENVLRLNKSLDFLYIQVVQDAKKWDHFDVVIGCIIYLRKPLSINELAPILITNDRPLTSSMTRAALQGCHSILIIPEDDNTEIGFHHASLRDFLTDESRSGSLFFSATEVHAQIMVGCLESITRAQNSGQKAPKYALGSWHFHACMFLSSTDTGEEIKSLKCDTKKIFDKVDKGWVESWLLDASRWNDLSYMKGELPPAKEKTYIDQISGLEKKSRIISGILENPVATFKINFLDTSDYGI